jgi:hypothetical protein
MLRKETTVIYCCLLLALLLCEKLDGAKMVSSANGITFGVQLDRNGNYIKILLMESMKLLIPSPKICLGRLCNSRNEISKLTKVSLENADPGGLEYRKNSRRREIGFFPGIET